MLGAIAQTDRAGAGGRAVTAGLLGLTVAVLTLAISGRAAYAAPPEVTASENPVVIPFGQSTKDITLKWSLAAGSSTATLTVTESGIPAPVLIQLVSSPPGTGNVPLPVTYGKTYTARLTDTITSTPLGQPLTITTKRGSIAPPGQPIPPGVCLPVNLCITSIDVAPHGGWAQFTVKTNQTAIVTLKASSISQPNANGEWSNPAAVEASAQTILPTQNWTPQLPDLTPNTTYSYAVRAHGSNGNEQIKTGTFKTLKRRVEVTFAQIQMIDDSDGAFAGNCDCFFWFNAGNEEPKPYGTYPNNPKSIASGSPPVHPNVTFTIANAPSEIYLRVIGMDDDTDSGESCFVGWPAYSPGAHTGAANWETSGNFQECLEWAGDQILVSVSRQGPGVAPGSVDEEFSESFTISVSGELVFKVRGTYTVTYVS